MEKVLEKAKPDAVVVAGPDHLHADQSVFALEQGRHVLIEKPMATTVADAVRIREAEAKSGCVVMADHTKRYEYPWRDTSIMATSGELGDIFMLTGDYVSDMWRSRPDGKRRENWRADPVNPQNILMGGGCHPIDLMLWTAGSKVLDVYCCANKMSAPDFPDDDCYIMTIRFESGVMGKVWVSSGVAGGGLGSGMLGAYGTEASVAKGQVHRRRGDTASEPLVDTSSERLIGKLGWGKAVPEFFDTLDGKMANPIPSLDGARVVSVCEAGLTSAKTGKPQVPEWFE